MSAPKLDTRPARRLTSREVAKVLGALIGGITYDMSDPEEVRAAVRWWAETDEAWEGLAAGNELVRNEKVRQ